MTLHNNATTICEIESSLLKSGKPFIESDVLVDIATFNVNSVYNVAIFSTPVTEISNLGNVHTAIVITDEKTDEFDLDDSIFEGVESIGDQVELYNSEMKGSEIIELIKEDKLGFKNFLLITALMEASVDMNDWCDQNCQDDTITLGGEFTNGYILLSFGLKDKKTVVKLPNGLSVETDQHHLTDDSVKKLKDTMTPQEIVVLKDVIKTTFLFR
ncbi:hypothetical protein [Vibrio sp. D431a]|uniref:hypothetical protein n=1 Tax=Vibrio sp. D431a TaxID=2837388 RepID=UPI002552939C|nr:hypothetical protein [Vibrio sp. D431a]MDK9789892.1 hypothetical protein [Vibrio sp. D431a]